MEMCPCHDFGLIRKYRVITGFCNTFLTTVYRSELAVNTWRKKKQKILGYILWRKLEFNWNYSIGQTPLPPLLRLSMACIFEEIAVVKITTKKTRTQDWSEDLKIDQNLRDQIEHSEIKLSKLVNTTDNFCYFWNLAFDHSSLQFW